MVCTEIKISSQPSSVTISHWQNDMIYGLLIKSPFSLSLQIYLSIKPSHNYLMTVHGLLIKKYTQTTQNLANMTIKNNHKQNICQLFTNKIECTINK